MVPSSLPAGRQVLLGHPAHSFSADRQSDRGPGYVRDGYASLPRTKLPQRGSLQVSRMEYYRRNDSSMEIHIPDF